MQKYIGARIDKDALYTIYDAVSKECGITPIIDSIPEGISVKSRTDGENEYVFVMNFSESKKTVELGGKYTDILTGAEYDNSAELDEYKIIIIKR